MKKKFKNSQIFALIPILLFAFVSIANTYSQNGLNKFSDPIIREIHELADHRDSIALLKFLKDSNPNYQGEALIIFNAAVFPTGEIILLIPNLSIPCAKPSVS